MRRTATLALATLLLALPLALAPTIPAGATTFTPDTTADQNDGAGVNGTSLREAFDQANADDGPDTIVLAAGATYDLTICGVTDDEDANLAGDLDHTLSLGGEDDGLTIEGNGSTIRQTCEDERVVHTLAFGDHLFHDLTITGGDATSNGGGIRHNSSHDLDLEGVVVTGNQASGAGGGVWTASGGTVDGSFVHDNQAGTNGGGLNYNETVVVEDSTVHDNSASGLGGGVRSEVGELFLTNATVTANSASAGSGIEGLGLVVLSSTIAGNTGGEALRVDDGMDTEATLWDNPEGCDVGDGAVSFGHNYEVGTDTCDLDDVTDVVEGADAGLEAPSDNGGLGLTRRPDVGSPLVDAIPEEDCDLDSDPDAVGTDRPVDGDFDGNQACDIGALERPQAQTFSDVAMGHPFFEEIGFMAFAGISTGYGDGTYKPSAAVTRQAMSAFMYRLAGEPEFVAPGTPTFGDVPTDHPFYDEIEWMADEEISTGYGDGTYRPADVVTRQAMSAFMYRLAGEPEFLAPGTPTFGDVPTDHPFYDEIEWMADQEISTGYQPGPTYRPAAAVSRQAMSAFMQRLALGPGVDLGG